MTLIVSMRIPDGIVIAGDSLSTMTSNMAGKANLPITCPECGHQHNVQIQLPAIHTTQTTFSYAQKVFPFLDKYGVGTFGVGQLMGRTLYFLMRQLEGEIDPRKVGGVTDVAEIIAERAQQRLIQQVQKEGNDINAMPDQWHPLGFQVVGYDGDEARTIELHIAKAVSVTVHHTPGITATGVVDVVQALMAAYEKKPQEKPVFDVFSLQDAISYADYLIHTTATQQQFSRTIPNVGGSIDIALVTPFDNFTWIRQKTLRDMVAEI